MNIDIYTLIRSLLFLLPAEASHNISLNTLKTLIPSAAAQYLEKKRAIKPVSIMGLAFTNPVGLAAGLDKNGDYLDVLGALGFGFIEVGTVTPKPQSGNPKPRLFRIPEQQAIINRMGFNNKGIDHLITQIKKSRYSGIIGINIGKNKSTPLEKSVDDYLVGLEKAYNYADYITINISSPNTPGLRDLQKPEMLNQLLSSILKKRQALSDKHGKNTPIVLKIAPDIENNTAQDIAGCLINHKIDGLIVSNTTNSRPKLEHNMIAKEAGGLSGKPLLNLANTTLETMHILLKDEIPLIGVGGILSAQDALAKFDRGAKLVQIYSGLIYKGPSLLKEINQAL